VKIASYNGMVSDAEGISPRLATTAVKTITIKAIPNFFPILVLLV
jgi:hypothetical protein